ncbi:ABC transporter substrate-binding protein [Alkalibacillus salilacus]|uniref:ABC-type nitrate/sulfonate/bicarbonate transport system substrate-binding protein n=1 Tax=Alkalibacillus salilacus TaxID=284582 RepID=A0ABT9VH16_9BACI|nr:ABC transporter substrate-binding protein [Alkalibacillus salilacus]MDQ0160253.1 ABC-type nitrate/sulfonate/bicarbonate transport system substrate-binding protein [Alkalibacillus salilacus]
MKKLFLLILLLGLLTACSDNENNESQENQDELTSVDVVLDWTPNTNHTGLYVAQAEGYFEEQGLDVNIILPGEASPEQMIASGEVDFGISFQENITEARVQDVPVVSIAAVIQHNTSGFAALEGSGITSPADFEGKIYGGWGAPLEEVVISSLMQQEGADVDEVETVNIGDSDFFTAVERQDIDFGWIYYGWDGIEAELRGTDLNMIYLTDYSEKLDYYTPVLATSESIVNDQPDLAKSFIHAASEGYQFAIENPEEAANILIEAEPDLDKELVKASQEWLSPRYQDDASRWGQQELDTWENYAEWMQDHDLLDGEFTAEDAFTNEFLPEED